MASSSLTSTLTSQSKSPFYPQQLSQLASSPLFSFARSLKTFRTNAKSLLLHKKNSSSVSLTVKAQTLDFSGSFFEGGGFGSDDDPTSVPPGSVGTATAIEDKEEPQCPPGLRQYETMMVLRPDMSEDERLALTQKYEECFEIVGDRLTLNTRTKVIKHIRLLSANQIFNGFMPISLLLVAGGGMYVEVFNRGVIPLAYSIRKRNKAGESNTYLDGIYLLFTYFTKPESIEALERTMKADDDVIRSSSFKVRKQKQKG
ncbi:hypothetical protein WN943_012988 [Citrus x changshan-huyou]